MTFIIRNRKYLFNGNKVIVHPSGEIVIPQPTGKSALYAYDAGSQHDVMLDLVLIDSSSGVTFEVNRPTKSIDNPIFPIGVNNDTWDHDKNYCCVSKIGSLYYMWYSGVWYSGGVVKFYMCLATSTDGITWVKPTDGMAIDGFTNTNIILAQGAFDMCVVYNPDGSVDERYVMTLEQRPGDTHPDMTYIYKCSDATISSGITLVSVKNLDKAGSIYSEPKCIIKRPDGRWLAYYTYGHSSQDRELGCWLSDSTDISGSWTDLGSVITTPNQDDQKYNIGVSYMNGIYYGFVSNYNKTTEQIFIDLYISRDGISWTKKSSQWIPLGIAGAWDDQMIMASTSMINEGANWNYYFNGYAENHAHSLYRDARIGMATIKYERIGQASGIGNIITTSFTPTDILTINASCYEGMLKVELLDSSDSIISGYSKEDMDAISGDNISVEITWGGQSIPTDTELKIKFYLY